MIINYLEIYYGIFKVFKIKWCKNNIIYIFVDVRIKDFI